MDNKPSFNNFSDLLNNGTNQVIDLTKSLDDTLEIYSSDDYSDPELEVKTWCSYMERGFRVSRIMMGTQTGTHIDAPSHFVDGGAFLHDLEPRELMGRYFFIDSTERILNRNIIEAYDKEPFLFIRGKESVIELKKDLFTLLLDLDARIWIAAGLFTLEGEDEFSFNRGAALRGKYIVEDLDMSAASLINRNGYIFTMPLRLVNTSGAPCRVIAVQDN